MSILSKVSETLVERKGLAAESPRTVAWSDDGDRLEMDFVAIDSLSCAMRELRFSSGSLRDAGLDALRRWADALCDRISYLLERIGPLEVDPGSTSILIRSTPPDRGAGTIAYYEVLVTAGGGLTVRRFGRTPGDAERQPLDIRLTHEALRKLVQDLIQTSPAAASNPAAAGAA